MPKTYELNGPKRVLNELIKRLIALGIGPARLRLLSVPGRKSGRTYTTPVNLVERGGERYLVAPYGERSWVKNARVAGAVTLRRGDHEELRRIEALDAQSAAPVLKQYVRENPITRPYFGVPSDAPEEAFVAEARTHPVFRLV
jgi:deazaflavin-dependent oxidoreductase (nitroreductase family)